MQEIQDSPVPESAETRWTDYVEAAWDWRRFVVIGIVAAWAAIGLLALLGAEAVRVPGHLSGCPGWPCPRPALPRGDGTTAQRPGITLALYKRLRGARGQGGRGEGAGRARRRGDRAIRARAWSVLSHFQRPPKRSGAGCRRKTGSRPSRSPILTPRPSVRAMWCPLWPRSSATPCSR